MIVSDNIKILGVFTLSFFGSLSQYQQPIQSFILFLLGAITMIIKIKKDLKNKNND